MGNRSWEQTFGGGVARRRGTAVGISIRRRPAENSKSVDRIPASSGVHSFSAPAVRPLTIFSWANSTSRAIGMIPIRLAAAMKLKNC